MRIFRRIVLPVAWLAVFAVIAVALVKIAFVDGMKPQQGLMGPSAEVAIPVVQATRATVTNTVEVQATVDSDAAVAVKNTTAGTVTHLFISPGEAVPAQAPLYQVRAEVQPDPAATARNMVSGESEGGAPEAPARTAPVYTYTDVYAPVSGNVETLTVLIDQQVSVGETTATVNPGTFTVSGSIDAAQQYRLLAKPGSAVISVVGGPAPFTCPAVTLKSMASTTGGAGAGAGGVSRGVPFASAGPLGGTPAEGGTPTGTISCPVPIGIEVFAGLGATMTVTAGQSADVVTVPLTAVRGTVTDGIVWVSAGGPAPGAPAPDRSTSDGGAAVGGPASPAPGEGSAAAGPAGPGVPGVPGGSVSSGPSEERKVQLGLNDGSRVEVVSGLSEGEFVLEFIPGAPAQVQPGLQPGMAYPAGG
jgi:multidrug efflux pump subunit AcrA (membrane-fusion protein)